MNDVLLNCYYEYQFLLDDATTKTRSAAASGLENIS